MSARRLCLLAAFVVVSGFGATLATPDCAHACSCGAPAGASPQDLVRQGLRSSDAVFAGEVTGIDRPRLMTSSSDPMSVTFRVAEAWKGAEGETVDVKTAVSDVSCGYPFDKGDSYLVFASKGTTYGDGDLEVALCGSTKPLSEADTALAALGPGEAPTGSSASADQLPDTSGGLPGFSGLALISALLAVGTGALVGAALRHRPRR